MNLQDHPKSARAARLRCWPLVVLALLMFGAAAAASSPSELTNTMCPVMEDDPVDPEIFVEHEGQRVYLCCDRCVRRFEMDPDRYAEAVARVMSIADAPAGQATPADAHDDRPAHDHDHGHDHTHDHADHAPEPDAPAHDAQPHDHHDHAAHDHAPEATQPLLRFIYWLGNFHPPAVAFPVGLLIAAGVAELLSIITGRSRFDHAAQFCAWFGIVATVAAGILGWFFAGFRLIDEDWLLTTHRWLGTATVLWMLPLGWLATRAHGPGQARWRGWYRLVLLMAIVLVAASAYLGGAMIYGLDHYAW